MAATTGYDRFSVAFTRDRGTVVVHVTGDVDTATAPAVRQALAGVIDEQGSLSVRVDLTGMTFIDSTGLSVLVAALTRMREKGGTLTLANPSRTAIRLFEMVGFTTMFDIAEARQQDRLGY
jgi:anti-sigma B factor antagonist